MLASGQHVRHCVAEHTHAHFAGIRTRITQKQFRTTRPLLFPGEDASRACELLQHLDTGDVSSIFCGSRHYPLVKTLLHNMCKGAIDAVLANPIDPPVNTHDSTTPYLSIMPRALRTLFDRKTLASPTLGGRVLRSIFSEYVLAVECIAQAHEGSTTNLSCFLWSPELRAAADDLTGVPYPYDLLKEISPGLLDVISNAHYHLVGGSDADDDSARSVVCAFRRRFGMQSWSSDLASVVYPCTSVYTRDTAHTEGHDPFIGPITCLERDTTATPSAAALHRLIYFSSFANGTRPDKGVLLLNYLHAIMKLDLPADHPTRTFTTTRIEESVAVSMRDAFSPKHGLSLQFILGYPGFVTHQTLMDFLSNETNCEYRMLPACNPVYLALQGYPIGQYSLPIMAAKIYNHYEPRTTCEWGPCVANGGYNPNDGPHSSAVHTHNHCMELPCAGSGCRADDPAFKISKLMVQEGCHTHPNSPLAFTTLDALVDSGVDRYEALFEVMAAKGVPDDIKKLIGDYVEPAGYGTDVEAATMLMVLETAMAFPVVNIASDTIARAVDELLAGTTSHQRVRASHLRRMTMDYVCDDTQQRGMATEQPLVRVALTTIGNSSTNYGAIAGHNRHGIVPCTIDGGVNVLPGSDGLVVYEQVDAELACHAMEAFPNLAGVSLVAAVCVYREQQREDRELAAAADEDATQEMLDTGAEEEPVTGTKRKIVHLGDLD